MRLIHKSIIRTSIVCGNPEITITVTLSFAVKKFSSMNGCTKGDKTIIAEMIWILKYISVDYYVRT